MIKTNNLSKNNKYFTIIDKYRTHKHTIINNKKKLQPSQKGSSRYI